MKISKLEVSLVEGFDKSVSTRMKWNVNNGRYYIERYQMGGTNTSSFTRRQVVWSVSDNAGKSIFIPSSVRRHEVSIAKYLVGGISQ